MLVPSENEFMVRALNDSSQLVVSSELIVFVSRREAEEADYSEGQEVFANRKGNGTWFPAKITKVIQYANIENSHLHSH